MPLHPSFEDRPGALDRLFAAVAPEQAEHQVRAWEIALTNAGFDAADVIHLHHLTPLHDVVARRWPDRPLVTHLHGTELKMPDGVARRRAVAATLGTDLAGMAALEEADETPSGVDLGPEERDLLARTRWAQWRYGDHWEARLRAAAARSDGLVFISAHDRDEAFRLLDVSPDLVEVIPNGVDTERFDRRPVTVDERLALLRRWLVDDPRGWGAGTTSSRSVSAAP